MDLFQIMCANGCSNEPGAWYLMTLFSLNIIEGIVRLALLVYIVIKILKFDHHKKGIFVKELVKPIIKAIIIAIVIIILLSVMIELINYLANYPEYDDLSHCWCA